MAKMTPSGYKKLKQELEQLEQEERPRIAKILKDAIAQGDLSENFAYHDGKTRQAKMEDRISFLKNELKHATITTSQSTEYVQIGHTITLQTADNKERVYTLTGKEEADPSQNKISYDSPIGSATLNQKVGTTIKVETPNGMREYTLIHIA